MTTNTTTESFTRETLIRSFTRRAVAIRLRHGGTKRAADQIDGLTEGLCILQVIAAPPAFIIPLRNALNVAGQIPPSNRGDWIEGIVEDVAKQMEA